MEQGGDLSSVRYSYFIASLLLTPSIPSAPLRLNNPDLELINDIYDQLGPVPRTCFEDVPTREVLEECHSEIDFMLGRFKADDFNTLIGDTALLAMDTASHKICVVRRRDKTITHANRLNVSSRIQVMPITNCIGSKLVLHYGNLTRRLQVEIYRYFAPFPSTRGMTGSLFEAYCQQIFQGTISIEYIPMVRLPDPEPAHVASKRRKVSDGAMDGNTHRPQWHSSHTVLANRQLEDKRRLAEQNKVSLDICPSSTYEYREDDFERFKAFPDVYYIPRESNQVALDSFIIHIGLLYIFQFAGGKQHGIKEGLIPFLEKCTGLPPRDNWRFVFIIPDDSEVLKCPTHLHPMLQTLPLFSSMVALKDE
jgi:hypothetical protein